VLEKNDCCEKDGGCGKAIDERWLPNFQRRSMFILNFDGAVA
jgi:hypothetical protein